MKRILGVLLLVLMVVHVCLRPQGIWVLASTCDIAALATAIGLVTLRHRLVASAFLFQVSVGFPSLVVGMFTTYDTNVTGVAVHVVPLAIGGVMVARHGLPRYSALFAWLGYAASIAFAYAFAPPALHVNFTDAVWPPLAKSMSLPVFHAILLAIIGTLLALASLGSRKLLVRR
jgi:hypothetical protein